MSLSLFSPVKDMCGVKQAYLGWKESLWARVLQRVRVVATVESPGMRDELLVDDGRKDLLDACKINIKVTLCIHHAMRIICEVSSFAD